MKVTDMDKARYMGGVGTVEDKTKFKIVSPDLVAA